MGGTIEDEFQGTGYYYPKSVKLSNIALKIDALLIGVHSHTCG